MCVCVCVHAFVLLCSVELSFACGLLCILFYDYTGRANCAGDNWNYLNYPIEVITTGIANYP